MVPLLVYVCLSKNFLRKHAWESSGENAGCLLWLQLFNYQISFCCWTRIFCCTEVCACCNKILVGFRCLALGVCTHPKRWERAFHLLQNFRFGSSFFESETDMLLDRSAYAGTYYSTLPHFGSWSTSVHRSSLVHPGIQTAWHNFISWRGQRS